MLTEKTIDQILGVLDLTVENYISGLPIPKAYQKSVKDIAQRYSISYQTISDGCRRRLGLENVNRFIALLEEWLEGKPNGLRELLINNAADSEHYRINNFFDKAELPSKILTKERNTEEILGVVSLKIPQNVMAQLQSLAEAKGGSIQDLAASIIKEYVEKNYIEYVKNIIDALPQRHKEQVLAALSKG